MANTDNTCAKLEIEDLWTDATHTPKYDHEKSTIGSDTLGDILNLQSETQKSVYGYDFQSMSLREIMEFWHMNNHAMIDEIHEATDALGGISEGGNAIWKKWKKAYPEYSNKKFSDLSLEDQLECKKEMYNMYMSKNKENRDRQKRGY